MLAVLAVLSVGFSAHAESNRFLSALNGGQASHESVTSAPPGTVYGTWGGPRNWTDGCTRGGGCKVPTDVTDGIANAALVAADLGVTPGMPPAPPGTVYGSPPPGPSCNCGVANNDASGAGFNPKGGNAGG